MAIRMCQHCGQLIVWRHGAWLRFDQPANGYPTRYPNDMCAPMAFADDETHTPLVLIDYRALMED